MKQFFEDYGWLEWLEPVDFWKERWSIYETTKDKYGDEWDIVICDGKFKYTTIQ